MSAISRPYWLLAFLLAGCVTPPTPAERDLAQHLSDGSRLYKRGAYPEAREQYRAALVLRPDAPGLQYRLGMCAEAMKETAEAEALYRACIERAPGHEGAHHALAQLMLKGGRETEARQFVQGWLVSHPDTPGPYVEAGLLHLRDGDLDSARGRLQQAIDLDHFHPRALMELARLYERLNDPGRAAHLYELAAQTSPDPTEARARLAVLSKNGPPRLYPD
jgi:tetratricopeptide (TPR) repeat protein